MIPIVIGELETVSKNLVMGVRRVENQRTNLDHPNYKIKLEF